MELILKAGEKLSNLLKKKGRSFEELFKIDPIFIELYELFSEDKNEFIENFQLYGLPIFLDKNILYLKTKETNLENLEFCIVDLEWTVDNTSKKASKSRPKPKKFEQIIEIAGIKIKNGKIIDTFESFIFSDKVDPIVTELTGITVEHLENAPNSDEVLSKFRVFLKDSIFVAHGVENDSRVIKNEFKRMGIPFLNPTLCTFDLSSKIFALYKYNLENLNEVFDICQEKEMHRAMIDTKITLQVFNSILIFVSEQNIKSFLELKKWSEKQPSKQFDFLERVKVNEDLNFRFNTMAEQFPEIKIKNSNSEEYFGFFNGALNSKTNEISIGFTINDNFDKELLKVSEKIGFGTINEAEYIALLSLLEIAILNKISKFTIFGNNKLIINQVNSILKVDFENLKPLKKKFDKLQEEFDTLEIELISNDENNRAEFLSKDAFTSNEYE